MRCWCGRRHPKADVRNGEVKHFVINWKLYQLRNDQGKGRAEREQKVKPGEG